VQLRKRENGMAADGAAARNGPRLGARIRRLRREQRLNQAQLAQKLGISASYLNLIEHNRRNVTVPLLLRLAELFGLDLTDLGDDDESRLAADLMEALGDDLFAEAELSNHDVRDLVASNPAVGRALLGLYDAYRRARADLHSFSERLPETAHAAGDALSSDRLPSDQVSDFIQANANHFPELEAAAERVGEDLVLAGEAPWSALVTYLGNVFGVRVALLPPAAEGTTLRRFDPAARRLEISQRLPAESRTFQLAHQIALLAAGETIDRLLASGELAEEARALGRIALANYVAGALLMPYERFLERAQALRYDIELLAHEFGASFEQVCHRLTTLQRPSRRGVPFHMLRTDIAGNISKRFSLSGIHIPRHTGACPRWNVYTAFLQPGAIHAQISRMPDGTSYFCIARTVKRRIGGHGTPESHHAIGLGCDITHARELVYADGIELDNPDRAVPIGTACRICPRMDCQQRAFPPIAHPLAIDENRRTASPYVPGGDP